MVCSINIDISIIASKIGIWYISRLPDINLTPSKFRGPSLFLVFPYVVNSFFFVFFYFELFYRTLLSIPHILLWLYFAFKCYITQTNYFIWIWQLCVNPSLKTASFKTWMNSKKRTILCDIMNFYIVKMHTYVVNPPITTFLGKNSRSLYNGCNYSE